MKEDTDFLIPEWYLETLIDRHQYLVEELAQLNSKRIYDSGNVIGGLFFGTLAYFAFENFWASALVVGLLLRSWGETLGQKRFFVSAQILEIREVFPLVVENTAPLTDN